MKAVVVGEFGNPESIHLKEIPVPTPAAGEVLIQMEAAPINPSDVLFVDGFQPKPKTKEIVPGFEGSGIVVSAGSGLVGNRMIG